MLSCSEIPSKQLHTIPPDLQSLERHLQAMQLDLECWVKSVLEFDHDGLVIIILHKVYELLESVNVVINWVLALVPAGAFQLGEGCELFILQTELIKEGLFKCFPVSEVVSFALAFRLEHLVCKVGCLV